MGVFHQAWEYHYVDPAAIPPEAVQVRDLRDLARAKRHFDLLTAISRLTGDEAREAWTQLNDGSTFGEFQAWQRRVQDWLGQHAKSDVRRLLVKMPTAKLWLEHHPARTPEEKAETARRNAAKNAK